MRRPGHSRKPLTVGLGLLLLLPLVGARSCLKRTDYREKVLIGSKDDPKLRVALVRDAPSLDLESSGPLEVSEEGRAEPILDLSHQDKITIFARRGKLVWGAQLLESNAVRVVPAPGGTVEINGTPFRGEVRIHSVPTGAVSCVNEIALGTYLAGVLGAEVPTTWPDAALRAQAIAARTYALHAAWQQRDALYDVTADTLSQVYRGLEAEDQTAFRVVHETRGVILVYGGKIFPTYYMSVCGGHTASSAKVFGGAAIPPLSGTPCGYCRGAERFSWPSRGKKVYFTEETILSSLGSLGIPLPRVERIEGLQAAPDGYAARISLRTGGETFTVSAQKFRMALGPNRLLSTNFQAEREGVGFNFRGKGWGHGVGMCQWGTYGMARAGKDEREILKHYYPGSNLVRLRRGT